MCVFSHAIGYLRVFEKNVSCARSIFLYVCIVCVHSMAHVCRAEGSLWGPCGSGELNLVHQACWRSLPTEQPHQPLVPFLNQTVYFACWVWGDILSVSPLHMLCRYVPILGLTSNLVVFSILMATRSGKAHFLMTQLVHVFLCCPGHQLPTGLGYAIFGWQGFLRSVSPWSSRVATIGNIIRGHAGCWWGNLASSHGDPNQGQALNLPQQYSNTDYRGKKSEIRLLSQPVTNTQDLAGSRTSPHWRR